MDCMQLVYFEVQPKNESHYASDIKKERKKEKVQNSVTRAISVPCLCNSKKWKCSSKWVLIHLRPWDLLIRDPQLLSVLLSSLDQ